MSAYVWLWTGLFIAATMGVLILAHLVHDISYFYNPSCEQQEKLLNKIFAVISGLLETHDSAFEHPTGLVDHHEKLALLS